MISTLIRSKQDSLPSNIEGRSEYLVDTENNSIIYPKTRLEDIIGLENFSPDTPSQRKHPYYFKKIVRTDSYIIGHTRFENLFDLSQKLECITYL